MSEVLQDQIAIVTGGGQGLGQAICWRLAREGCSVVVADLNEETARQTAAEISQYLQESKTGRRAIPVKVDVTDEAQVAAMVDRAVEEFGRLDILVGHLRERHHRHLRSEHSLALAASVHQVRRADRPGG